MKPSVLKRTLLVFFLLLASLTVKAQTSISTLQQLQNLSGRSGSYVLTADIDASGMAASIGSFSGTFDGGFHKITGLTVPLFHTVTDAHIRNLVIDSAEIDVHLDANVYLLGWGGRMSGILVNHAGGDSRIYNCGVLGSRIGGLTGYNGASGVGGLVGQIDGNARVINCYSFASVENCTWPTGIVANNAVGAPGSANPAASDIHTMVMNCMFYGNLSGDNPQPIYGGKHIQNIYLPTYNYYAYEKLNASVAPDDYRSALAAEDKYLKRFEFYRGILNSNRKMAAWYISGNVADTALVGKWVLDESVAEYPILKPWGTYPSVVNRASYQAGAKADLEARVVTPSEDLSVGTDRYEGKTLGVLKVTLKKGTYGSGDDDTIYLPITDMDTAHFDYNYYKVQLPYYNDHFTGNYGDYAVTGWDVSNIVGGTAGSVSTSGNNAYNYADRNCTAKDQQRTFAQGGFYHVPEGVTEITLTAHWGVAVYLSDVDNAFDRIYTGDGATTKFDAPGYFSHSYGTVNSGNWRDRTPTTRFTDWNAASKYFTTGESVYDNVIVLVSNYHATATDWNEATKPYTIMSIDENGDNEPDFCLYQEFNNREDINAIRFDFVYHVWMGMAKKRNNSPNFNGIGIFHPKGWFEVTETALAHYTEFEYDQGRTNMAPLILNAGIVDQIVSAHNATSTKTQYVILGGHLYMKAYTPGCHADGTNSTTFAPVNVIGGEIGEMYLTGMRPDANAASVDGRVYTNGGKMHTFAAAYQEQLKGNLYARFDHTVVHEFYGGGTNAAKPVTGNINVTINNSMVGQYVGGPKFGEVASGMTVTTQANGTVFNYFYGASYGGTSYYKPKTNDATGATYDYSWISDNFNNLRLNSGNNGILVGYEIEFFHYAGGRTPERRLYQRWASMSLSTTHNTTSTLENCYIKNDFYGGGRIGKVDGSVTSTLTNCVVDGNAFGAGFSADIPTCEVMNTAVNPTHVPTYNQYAGIYNPIVYPSTVTYTWDDQISAVTGNRLPTTASLIDLGKVVGNVSITIDGGHIKGSVFGGGNASPVQGNTNVRVIGTAVIDRNVYGGGNNAEVVGNTNVTIGE